MSKIPNPYEKTTHYTERTVNERFVEWMNGLIAEKNIPLGQVLQETGGKDRKSPDIIIKKSPGSHEVLCLIELKLPWFDVFNEDELKAPAWRKAVARRAPYFCTCNTKQLVWFNTERVNKLEPEEKQMVAKYELCGISDPSLVDDPKIRNQIQRNLENFLIDLAEISTGKRPEPKHAIDEFLIARLQAAIKTLQIHYKKIVEDKVAADPAFSKKLQFWFLDQGWSFAFQDSDYGKAARQAAYLIVNKIFFYTALQEKLGLDPLDIPESLTDGGILQRNLQSYFQRVLDIDYETIFSTEFIDELAFPKSKDAVEEVKGLLKVVNKYKWSTVGYDVIGRIFEQLIPAEERHNLGQYFTNADVVDLILKFCLKNENDKVFDPSCGAGTFLVRAYEHKKIMNYRLKHEAILPTLWGNDIAKFAVHLATINLAAKDLGSNANYPRVVKKDFFEQLPDELEFKVKGKEAVAGLGVDQNILVDHPKVFDCIVGNPPYTRQEEMEDIPGVEAGYKAKLIERAVTSLGGKRMATLTKRAGIHAYFFVHGAKFLQNGGRFGFVVSNSWLDVDYGKGLQEFFLKYYKIVAIIESKVERWFADADVNTCIVILEKCSGDANKAIREANPVRFIQLKKPLRNFIPASENMWEKEVARLDAIDALVKTIMAHSTLYENDELRIYAKSQKELWVEGFDPETKKYTGAKWGKYLRAPDIFFKILEKGKDKLVPLKDLADVRRGFTTGANTFFYLTEAQIKRRGIEKEFWMHQENGDWVPNYLVKGPGEFKAVQLDAKNVKYRVLIIDKDKAQLAGTAVLKYIQWGEEQGFHRRSTCKPRQRWYELPALAPSHLTWVKGPWLRHFTGHADVPALVDQQLYTINLKEYSPKLVGALLNSTLSHLFKELNGRVNFGEGILWLATYEAAATLVIDPGKLMPKLTKRLEACFDSISHHDIPDVFSQIGDQAPGNLSLDKVSESQRMLDRIVMGDILGLTEDEQLEVYEAVIDLVKSRVNRAKSVSKTGKTKEGLDVDLLAQTIIDQLGNDSLINYYRKQVLPQPTFQRELPKVPGPVSVEQTLMGWQLKSGKVTVDSLNETQARYLKIWLAIGLEKVAVPAGDGYLETIIDTLEAKAAAAHAVIDEYLTSIVDRKTREKVTHRVWAKLLNNLETV